ncbi:hypothetical protein [uncultured Kordia sp.]|uniref:hypothetical protein n=1 Tax=uncultured Kordia sp. TaxID=507699 RepID=UPI002612C0BF|nr:hypothetical protein [uncultured Kordia sp.]
MATKEELEILKLEEELKQLKAPFWKKPSYLTIIGSGLTIIISAAIGFSSYYTKVDLDNKAKLEQLQNKIKESEKAAAVAKDETNKLKSETYKLRYEDYKNRVEDKKNELSEMEDKLKVAERRLNNYKARFKSVSSEVENYISKQYTPGFTEGILDTNEEEMKKFATNAETLTNLRKFIAFVVKRTYTKSNEKRKAELDKKLKKL